MDDDDEKFQRRRGARKGEKPAGPVPRGRAERPAGKQRTAMGGPGRDAGQTAARKVETVHRRRGAEAEEGERIAKRLARAGIASRRDAEELIAAGRVAVNGRKLSSPAFNVMPDDEIAVDGTPIPPIERTRLFLFHKPAGLVTTNRDPEGRRTVFDVLPPELPRLMTVGRLDINTEGLLLLTNDGGLARVLELPSTGWLRRYRVRVHGQVDERRLASLREGIAVGGVFYGSIEATLDREQGSNAWLTLGLREGKNREVKNILGALGLEVSRLIRISYGPFQLGELPEGHVQEIRGRLLRDQLGDRLIEESGANFEAPVVNQFSNRPVQKAANPVAERTARPAGRRDGERGRVDEGGLIRNRKRRENVRSERWASCRRDRRGRSAMSDRKAGAVPDRQRNRPRRGRMTRMRRSARERPPIEPRVGRTANVWMAPGARPIGAGRAAAEKAETEARRKSWKAGGRPALGKTGRGRGPDNRPEAEPGSAGGGKKGGRLGEPTSGPRKNGRPFPRPPGGGDRRSPPRGKGPGGGPRKR